MNPVEAELPAGRVADPSAPEQVFPLGRWTLFKNPFSKVANPKAAEAPTQGELSLDTVKPVRNDLSDSDLEVVPTGKSAPVAGPTLTTSGAPVPGRTDALVWDRIKAQFLGVGRT